MRRQEQERALSSMIGQRIRTVRQSRQLTQAGFGEALGVSQQTVARWESGQKRISAPTVCLVAEALHINPSEIIDVL